MQLLLERITSQRKEQQLVLLVFVNGEQYTIYFKSNLLSEVLKSASSGSILLSFNGRKCSAFGFRSNYKELFKNIFTESEIKNLRNLIFSIVNSSEKTIICA